jgi:phosphoribosylaminoimidazole-succinocarboxamide synthase
MLVRKAERIDIECVVRGFLAGSAWVEYRKHGTVAGERLPEGLRQAERLPEPIFTPAIKADSGHDENISIAELENRIGAELAGRLESASKAVYGYAADYATRRGILIADTKFEFGFIDGKLTLIDEILTSDSSRFWDAGLHQPGREQPSFDKQYLRDWLETSGWDKTPPGPEIPAEVVAGTASRYHEAFKRITGAPLWLQTE